MTIIEDLVIGQEVFITSEAVVRKGILFRKARVERVGHLVAVSWGHGTPNPGACAWTPELVFGRELEAKVAGAGIAAGLARQYSRKAARMAGLIEEVFHVEA